MRIQLWAGCHAARGKKMSHTAIGKAALPENKRRNGSFEYEGGGAHGPQNTLSFLFPEGSRIACEACG